MVFGDQGHHQFHIDENIATRVCSDRALTYPRDQHQNVAATYFDGTILIWTAAASPIITSASGFEERGDSGCLGKNGQEVEPNGVEASTRLRCVKSGADIASNIKITDVGREGAFLAVEDQAVTYASLRLSGSHPWRCWVTARGLD
ncbi:uncharacterized protein FMAN_15311 [Fusarium mangiferae]|uniref:Uncharacterized protein n=1 Tax=Fusarium mangiferae TaxID=192010 RepID=A0A1L7U8Y5_FUSMA|nr:uncharacterized protein FMAN_15311 [Fusarium mangiferae]CVL07180.1 uncharacterized protein FMAN_15311 [Fusarium mangiferae]